MATFNVEDMLLSLQASLDPLYLLVTGAAYVMGVTFLFRGLYYMKIYGDARTMMSSQASIKEPIFNMIAGAMLIYLPTGFSVIMMTTFGYDNVLAYDQFPVSDGQSLSQGAIVLLQMVQLVGVCAFVRGWLLLSRSAGQGGGHQGLFGKGLTHVFGGAFAMNIVGTFNIIAATFGITF